MYFIKKARKKEKNIIFVYFISTCKVTSGGMGFGIFSVIISSWQSSVVFYGAQVPVPMNISSALG